MGEMNQEINLDAKEDDEFGKESQPKNIKKKTRVRKILNESTHTHEMGSKYFPNQK